MNKKGAAGLAALNPATVVAYLDSYVVLVPTDNGRKTKVLNGYRMHPDDVRIIRRWRNQAKGVSPKALVRIQQKYGMGTIRDFTRWAKRHHLTISA